VHERIRLAIIPLDETEALHGIEELDGAACALTGQLALRATITTGTAGAGTRTAILHGHDFAFQREVGRGDTTTAIDEAEGQLLPFAQAGQTGLFDGRDVNEYVLATIITDDEAEALLSIEEFNGALAFADDLGRHAAATTAGTATEATTATAAIATATTAAATKAITAAEAAAAEAVATAAIAAASATKAVTTAIVAEAFFAKTVALVPAALSAPPTIETHAVKIFPNSPLSFASTDAGRATRESCGAAGHAKPRSALTEVWSRPRVLLPHCMTETIVGIERSASRAYLPPMSVYLHEEDLPADALAPGPVAVDTETMGLNTFRDRLCVVQISDGGGDEHLVRFAPGSDYAAPNLRAVLADPNRLKLYHFARFDLAAIRYYLGVWAAPVYCTKTASRLIRTYTDRHGLKELVRELLGQELSKQQQSSDWGAGELSEPQKEYAASDVRYLHQLRILLDQRLLREKRMDLAQACFDFLPARAELDLAGWPEIDIFAHI